MRFRSAEICRGSQLLSEPAGPQERSGAKIDLDKALAKMQSFRIQYLFLPKCLRRDEIRASCA